MVVIANLVELSSTKARLLQTFLSNQALVDLIKGTENNPLPALDLRYSQVFPYAWVDETITEQKTYLCFELDVPRVYSGIVKEVQLSVWLFTHKSLMRTPSGTLIDRIASAIDLLLNGSSGYGASDLELKSVGRINVGKDFYGRSLTYTVKDINRWKCCLS